MRSTPKDSGQPRAITGQVPTAPANVTGPGWSANKSSTGVVVVRFVPPFKNPPAITTTVSTGNNAFVVAAAFAADQFTGYIYTSNTGATQDAPFAFRAEGL